MLRGPEREVVVAPGSVCLDRGRGLETGDRRRMLEQLEAEPIRMREHDAPNRMRRELERELARKSERGRIERFGGLEVGHRQADVVERDSHPGAVLHTE